MDILRDFQVKIDEKTILRLLGYKDSEPDDEIVQNVREEISGCGDYISPFIAFNKLKISKVEEDRVTLENGVIFDGEFIAKKLQKCSHIIVGVSTIGRQLDERVKGAFDSGDYLKGMIIDHIGTTAVDYINKSFWNRMVEDIKNTNIGITSRLSPGDTSWNITEQRKIFQCLEEGDILVKLTESFMMIPFKSTSYVYGFGEGIGVARIGHVCSECNMKHCAYRMDDRVELRVKEGESIQTIDVKPGSNLLEVLRLNNIFVPSPCGGKGICGKCKIKLVKGFCKSPSETEKKYLSQEEIDKGFRLSCNILVESAVEIEICNGEENIEVLTAGENLVEVDPPIIKNHCVLEKPSIHDQRDDLKRLEDSLGAEKLHVNYKELVLLSDTLRSSEFNVTATLYKNKLIHLESGNTTGNKYGLAIDIGTTTIACYLLDLNTGKTMDVESQVNKQRAYGSDVISRINYTIEKPDGLNRLKKILIEQLNDMINNLCTRSNISSQNIYDIVVAGNTTMIHTFLELPCKNIALAPYIPAATSEMVYDAAEIGICTKGKISIMPGIASYVGSDITAGILSSGMLKSEKYSLLLDLGTNGEIVLGNCREVITCSTAAGPAFEGANIKHGIGGIRGAISTIDLSQDRVYDTIGKDKPCGICGSGVLDAVAELVKHGVVDETGRMVDEDEIEDPKLKEKMTLVDGIKAFVLAEDTAKGERIVFTQKDVREVQLAKAAICAGIDILLKERGIKYSEVENLYIGGGFGNYMNIDSALFVGMIPKGLRGKIKSIGNCAGSGAKSYLLSSKARIEADEIKLMAQYIELSKRQDFQEHFVDSMMFE
jgi:uncharacterized 2Fe-2S/4Fe-4S cluster protein (DUF4445 family)